MKTKSIGKIVIFIVVIYLLLIMAAFLAQEKLIFHPQRLSQAFQFNLRQGDEEVFLTTSDGKKINALFYPGQADEVILYFHGNAGSLAGWQQIADDFTGLGYNFLIIDYRGYGKSSGEITEQGLYLDGDAAFRFLVEEKGFQPEQVIIYGRSIGSGIATELAKRRDTKGLVLESPFSSLKTLANQKMPFLFPSLFLQFHFDNIGKLTDIDCPILFIHGGRDGLIPASHSKNLHEAYSGEKKLIVIPHGSHNDLNLYEEYHEALAWAFSEFF
ncbi:hypothetical protein C900_03956 [Fulvivirga imtechensis AK7]|uniref:Serine aminopeptidase S33 domain-containing protein n=1 Tax=Fulvivirga imtechensis AK7 TaxID=1237149 RepID=L8JMY2_9BACT|nr:alpha/beta hydrolase [Fulvivirga imtechensis]ELR70271.1 hypothetical protein C900_03956 [Fulvivirga imtechensis AK7]